MMMSEFLIYLRRCFNISYDRDCCFPILGDVQMQNITDYVKKFTFETLIEGTFAVKIQNRNASTAASMKIKVQEDGVDKYEVTAISVPANGTYYTQGFNITFGHTYDIFVYKANAVNTIITPVTGFVLRDDFIIKGGAV